MPLTDAQLLLGTSGVSLTSYVAYEDALGKYAHCERQALKVYHMRAFDKFCTSND